MRGKSIVLLEPGSFLKRMIRIMWRGPWGRDVALAMLRHELRTPLTGILGMAALLRESRLDTEQLQFLTALEQSGRQLADLLERPASWLRTGLANANIDATVNAATFNGLHLLEGITRTHWPAARNRGLGIFLVFDYRLPAFWRTDPALLREAIDNLLTNAIKFTPSGGYVLLEARRLGRGGRAEEGIELRVSDTGLGIPRRDERRIYSFGQRGSEEQARRSSGSGYGLFICNRIADVLGGSLDHHRSRSGGTCFTMRLPGIALAFSAATERLRPKLLRGMSCRVSLPPPLNRVVAHALRRMGITVSFRKLDVSQSWPESMDARFIDFLPREGGSRDEAAGAMDLPADRFPAIHCRSVLLGRPSPASPGASGPLRQAFSSVLPEPVLHANLEPLMLQLALHLRMHDQ